MGLTRRTLHLCIYAQVMQDLISAASDDASSNRGRQHCFTLVTLDRTIHLSADSPEDFKE